MLENTIRVFDELSCIPDDYVKGVVSLLKDTAYQWWNTLVSIVPRERMTWEFFQMKFCKKYISQRFLDQKHKEFLELKQSRRTVIEYEGEFFRLSKYAWECVATEEMMCKRFVNGLNEDIKLLVEILDLKEFVVLIDRACKAKELSREKRKADSEAKDFRKRYAGKSHQSISKKSKDFHPRSTASVGILIRERRKTI
ncbi:uncharacterized protein [Gossypium hirsutum]|uniref:Retrotransposon gag domain-containing protein n=1 Tax=Gossypium hirsutum TaxID=3635 RepID=A0A1U8LLF6_GOSHI|nr:uncharacterized protein LOC107928667 [Gossypium hirsutum]